MAPKRPTVYSFTRQRGAHIRSAHIQGEITMSVTGKVGIVTGAGSGLGEAAAKRLAREGAKIIIVDRNQDGADRVAKEIAAAGGEAIPFVADVSVFEDTARLVEFAVSTYGGLHIAFNNAGVTPQLIDVHEIDPADWLRVIEVKPASSTA